MRKAQREFCDYAGTGIGIAEMSHRSAEFTKVAEHAEQLLRELLKIPDNYKVLFMQSGGRGQFAAIPLNLLPEDGCADYFVTGHWSRSALKECAERFGNAVAHECVKQDSLGRSCIDYSAMKCTPGAAYAYCCTNETVNGIEMNSLPDTGNVPLVADMSSNIMTRPFDVSRFGAVIFGVQKNIAPAGMVGAVVREDLLGHTRKYCPSVLDWNVMTKHKSMYNTPCCFSWYMAGLNFDWIKEQGGVEEMERRNREKSSLLYDYIDGSGFYYNKIAPADRSKVNCVFWLKDESLNQEFLEAAKAHRLSGLKGHKVLGGMRASLYNAMPIEGATVLINFLKEFAAAHAR